MNFNYTKQEYCADTESAYFYIIEEEDFDELIGSIKTVSFCRNEPFCLINLDYVKGDGENALIGIEIVGVKKEDCQTYFDLALTMWEWKTIKSPERGAVFGLDWILG